MPKQRSAAACWRIVNKRQPNSKEPGQHSWIMGDHNVSQEPSEPESNAFMRALLKDLAALDRMIAIGQIESGIRRIGAEQEMFLIDRHLRPLPVAAEVLQQAADSRLTTEIGKFNLEANLSPQ